MRLPTLDSHIQAWGSGEKKRMGDVPMLASAQHMPAPSAKEAMYLSLGSGNCHICVVVVVRLLTFAPRLRASEIGNDKEKKKQDA